MRRIKPKQRKKSKKSAGRRVQPIVWAIDPVEHDAKSLRPLADAIKLWRGESRTSILPVSIVSPLDLKWPMDIGEPVSDEMVRMASGFIEPSVQKLFSDENMELQILFQKKPSLRQTAIELLRYSKKSRAQMIAMFTHGRKGLSRFAIGSFAELILTQSNIPVLLTNPKVKVSSQLKTIVFPTDFSRPSMRAFQNLIVWAKRRKVKIQLLHVFNFSTEFFPPIFEGLTTTTAIVDHAWFKAELNQKREGEDWIKLACDAGVEAEFIFSRRPGVIGEKIVQVSRECRADMIALSVSHNPISMSFLGGILREVLASAECPVLLMPSK